MITMSPTRLALDIVRQVNKYAVNPVMLHFAGRRHFYAGVIRHEGRRSGKQYATPIVADPTDDGYLVPLPYGTEVDWVRNVLAAGHATVQVHGETTLVTAPEIVPADHALALLAPERATYWRLMRMRSFLRLTKAPAPAGTAAPGQEPHAPAAKPAHKRTTAPRTRRATGSAPRAHRDVATDPGHPDLRQGDPRVHDLIAEIDEAIDAGDEPLVEQLSNRLAQLAPNTGAGADT